MRACVRKHTRGIGRGRSGTCERGHGFSARVVGGLASLLWASVGSREKIGGMCGCTAADMQNASRALRTQAAGYSDASLLASVENGREKNQRRMRMTGAICENAAGQSDICPIHCSHVRLHCGGCTKTRREPCTQATGYSAACLRARRKQGQHPLASAPAPYGICGGAKEIAPE